MLRLACVVVGSLAVATACGGGSSVPDAPPPLTEDSPIGLINERYLESTKHFDSLRGTIIGESSNGTLVETVWFDRGKARIETSGELGNLGYGGLDPDPDLHVWTASDSYHASRVEKVYCGGARLTEYKLEPSSLHFVEGAWTWNPERLTVQGAEPLAGRPTIYLQDSASGVEFWIDAVYGVLLKIRSKLGENTIFASEFDSIVYNESIDDDLFTTDFPDDWESCEVETL